jgi:hypothetical protein
MNQSLRVMLVLSLVARTASFAQTPSPPEIAVLQLKVIEGEGAIHTAGSHSASALTVLVSDETGRPVEGTTVSFRMPTDGALGVFASGLPTDVVVTGADGKASVGGIRWGKTAGPVRIRITAVKGDVRGGIFSSQYVAEPQAATARDSKAKRPAASSGRNRWVVIAVVAAGAAAGGLVVGLSGKAQTGAQAGAQASTSLEVGAPSIQVGKP